MKNFLKIFLLIFLVISSCKAKKAISETVKGDGTIQLHDIGNKIQSFQIGEIDEPVKEDLMFVIKDLTILEKKVDCSLEKCAKERGGRLALQNGRPLSLIC